MWRIFTWSQLIDPLLAEVAVSNKLGVGSRGKVQTFTNTRAGFGSPPHRLYLLISSLYSYIWLMLTLFCTCLLLTLGCKIILLISDNASICCILLPDSSLPINNFKLNISLFLCCLTVSFYSFVDSFKRFAVQFKSGLHCYFWILCNCIARPVTW